MPMFKALAACPAAVVIRPDMAKYREVGRAVRAELRRLTPLVEPVSIDEAFLDLSGTEKLYCAVPAQLLATLAQRVETTLKITLSIGLSGQQVFRQDCLRSRQAARLCGPQPQRCSGVFRRQAGIIAVGGGAASHCNATPMALPW
jgi:impB/mucB/samB family